MKLTDKYWFMVWLPRVLMLFGLIFVTIIEPIVGILGSIIYSTIIWDKKLYDKLGDKNANNT